MINHLNLSRCLKLIELVCANNNLIGLDLDNNPKLEVIDVSNNQIRANLSIFSHLKELVNLDLSRGNDFTGSLASLKDCRELAELNISGNKNIRGGLENLPAGEDFFISCQNTDFESQLAGHESRQEG
jgi:Leucine-rich repeat (LRR) protein